MKRPLLAFFAIFVIAQYASAQEKSFTLMGGMRINPMVVIDSEGNRKEFTRLHSEIGALLNQSVYLSAGYTPFLNSAFTFNEYWFWGFDSALPVSVVGILEHNFDTEKSFYNVGFNFKLKNGNGIVMIGSQFEDFDPIYKIGAFIPLSWVIYQK